MKIELGKRSIEYTLKEIPNNHSTLQQSITIPFSFSLHPFSSLRNGFHLPQNPTNGPIQSLQEVAIPRQYLRLGSPQHLDIAPDLGEGIADLGLESGYHVGREGEEVCFQTGLDGAEQSRVLSRSDCSLYAVEASLGDAASCLLHGQ